MNTLRDLFHIIQAKTLRLVLCTTFLMMWDAGETIVYAQTHYTCVLKVYQELTTFPQNSEAQKSMTAFVEKYDSEHLLGFLGKVSVPMQKATAQPLEFVASVNWTIQISLQQGTKSVEQAFSLTTDEAHFHQTKKVKLSQSSWVVIELEQRAIRAIVEQSWPKVKVTQEKIEGVSGIKVGVKYVLPPGVTTGVGYIKALMSRRSPKPLWLYRVNGNQLSNNLLIHFAKDTIRFQVFIPYHERPYWQPDIGFQLVHATEGRLLEHFWIDAKYLEEEAYDVKSLLFLRATSQTKIQAQGVFLGLKTSLPDLYKKDMRRNRLTLHLSGDIEPIGTNVWHYKIFSVEELATINHQILVKESFIPYAWLAKYADTIQFHLKAKMFVMSHRGTQFYNGYPRQQSHKITLQRKKLELVIPPMNRLKIRPIFFKIRKEQPLVGKVAVPHSRSLQLSIRIKKYDLYLSKSYAYKKTVRFYRAKKTILHLVKNDEITLEVVDNAYPGQVLFHTKIKCTPDILKQKFWKLKDKYGNYLKIGVQKLTTGKYKLLHTNGKKQTKVLGGRR